MKADDMIYCNDNPSTNSMMVTGEDQCENQGYAKELCMEVGCCQWSLDPQLNVKGCMSAIDDFLCAADDPKNPSVLYYIQRYRNITILNKTVHNIISLPLDRAVK